MSNGSTFLSSHCWTNNVRQFDPTLCMVCLIFPRAFHLALTNLLQACTKLSAFEYANEASRESNNHTKRLNVPFPNSILKLRPSLISHQRASNKGVKSLN